jgi:hypothetical protein
MAVRIDCPSNRINYKSAKNANGALIIKRLSSSQGDTGPFQMKIFANDSNQKSTVKFSLNSTRSSSVRQLRIDFVVKHLTWSNQT